MNDICIALTSQKLLKNVKSETGHMIKIPFFKYQGAGNDFVLIDNRSQNFNNLSTNAIKNLCDRRFGIGADGLMLLNNHTDFDFEMRYYNADGNLGSMCGNGGRCIVAFAKFLKVINLETNFLAVDGPHYAKISESGTWVELQMIDVDQIFADGDASVLNTGSPHFVQEVTGLEELDVYKKGFEIRNNETYRAEGINVNFVEDRGEYLFVRTFERGVEDETFACGTGVTAVAMAMAKKAGSAGKLSQPIKVKGGDLRIDFEYDGDVFSNVFLCGPAEQVFEGVVEL